MYNNKPQNINLRTLCTPGISYLVLSRFGLYLVLKLVPWTGKDNTGRDQYSKEKFISTTLNPDGAKFFYEVVTSILTGTETGEQFPVVFQCKRDTTLTIEYKDENNQMTAYLVGNKNNETIPFRFKTQQIQKWMDGQMVTQVIQADLEEFAMILYNYIQSSDNAEWLLNKVIGQS